MVSNIIERLFHSWVRDIVGSALGLFLIGWGLKLDWPANMVSIVGGLGFLIPSLPFEIRDEIKKHLKI